MRAILPIAALLFSTAGCYWSSPPQTPHRSTKVDLAKVPDLGTPNPRRVTGARVLVLGRFDSTAPQPIGGLYDRADYSVSPLLRTYFFKDGAVEVFEHVSDGLRAAGLWVFKDYNGHAEPALLEPTVRAKNPVLVTATVTALQHDQIREKGENQDWESARVEIDLVVRDTNGSQRLKKHYKVEGRHHYDGQTEVMKLIGWSLAEKLAADPEFLAAIEAKGGA
ncbi:MAG: hypothetical protein ACXVEF_05285 [Polyangiales bacterium]